jgi:DNA-binding transcriptional LysR family regulator
VNLSLRQLRAFVAIYQQGRLAAAAQALSITASAASLLLKQLEETLGVRLFDRNPQGLQPTAAAHATITQARRALMEVEQLGHSVRALGSLHQGRVAVAATPALASYLLPPVVRGFAALHPQVQIVLDDCAPDQLLARVLDETVDFALGTPEPPLHPGLRSEVLLRDQLSLICRRDHALAGSDELSWQQLQGQALITVKRGNGIRALVDQALAQSLTPMRFAFEVSMFSTAIALAEQGLGAAILPSFMLGFARHPELTALPLQQPLITRNVCLLSKAERSLPPAAAALMQALQRELGD